MTPLYAEDLISMLNDRSTRAVSGYDGICNRVINHDGLLKLLQDKVNDTNHRSSTTLEYLVPNIGEIIAEARKLAMPGFKQQIEEGCAEARKVGYVVTIEQAGDKDVVTVSEVRK